MKQLTSGCILFRRSSKPAAAGLLLCVLLLLSACLYQKDTEPADQRFASELVVLWNGFALDLERHTPGYRPPVSGRMFAYLGMAAYEASLPALEGYVSMEQYCPGYRAPRISDKASFNLPLSLNAAYAHLLRRFFPTAPQQLQEKLERLEQEKAQLLRGTTDPQRYRNSEEFGKKVAESVWLWSKTDTLGHDSYLYNYDRNYIPPQCSGCWQPSGAHATPALLPYWGRVRPFAISLEEFPVPPPVTYEEHSGSPFYGEALEVFSVSQPLSKENMWIAELWSDDLPGLTVTPAGRWVSVANQAFVKARPPFPKVIETYLKLGLALHDAAVVCWEAKYRFNLDRPENYIRRHIRADWSPLHDSPQFPAYPSGHSAFGAAAAEILTSALGEHFQLTDRTHEDRVEFAGRPRTYHSFAEMAKENASSRVFLGVHYRMDCEEGMRLGAKVGQKIAALPLKKETSAVLDQRTW